MAKMTKRILKEAVEEFTSPNNIANKGGLSSLLIPRKVNAKGAALLIGGATILNTGKEGLKARNANKMGKISYMDGPARMTKSFTSGAVPAMMKSSKGNYEAFSDMAEEVVNGHLNAFGSVLDDYGATPAMIASLYGMGGK